MTLPSQFLIRRNNDPNLEEVFGFIIAGKDSSDRYVFDIIPIFSGKIIKKSQYSYSDLIPRKAYTMKTARYSKEKGKILEYETDFWYEGLVVSIDGTNIPIINMYKACQILPGKFVYIEKPIFSEFAVRIQKDIPPKPVSLNPIDDYLKTHPNELCPILLIPLEKATLCLTPCGHGITHSAMLNWLDQKSQCPVCRQSCSVSNLLLPMRC